jgi:antitoxin YefM
MRSDRPALGVLDIRTISRTIEGMQSISASDARADLYNLIDRVGTEHAPVQITGKRGAAVLISLEDFSAIEETLYLLNIKGMRESIVEGMSTPIEDCSETIDL